MAARAVALAAPRGSFSREHAHIGRSIAGITTVARAIYRNLESLIAARARYAGIDVPVTLV
jgi:hypothetical protein